MVDESDPAEETLTPLAAKYRQEIQWFNQRLANARIHNSELERKIAGYRAALKGIADIEPGSRGAHSKFVDAQNRAKAALGSTASGGTVDGG